MRKNLLSAIIIQRLGAVNIQKIHKCSMLCRKIKMRQIFCKKGLTRGGVFGIINKLLRASGREKEAAKHLENYIVQTNKKRNVI